MTHHIHSRVQQRAGKMKTMFWRYRVWSTNVDAYLTAPLSERQITNWLMYHEHTRADIDSGAAQAKIDERLQRARESGTSCILDMYKRDPGGPWDTERCGVCNDFHHAYEPAAGGLCKSCGERRSDRGHRAPCKEVEG